MRWFALSLMAFCTVMVGCEQPTETIEVLETKSSSIPSPSVNSSSSAVTVESEAASTAVDTIAPPVPGAEVAAPAAAAVADPAAPAAELKPDAASAKIPSAARFVATQSVKVPTMMCPYSCWPKVKETLAAQPGVEAVQLAVQAKETEIDNPVVELKTTGDFDVAAAIAALEKASFADAVVVK